MLPAESIAPKDIDGSPSRTEKSMQAKEMITLSGVTKEYSLGKLRVEAVKSVNLIVAEGEFLALTGPSGSGKTTLLNLIGLMDFPSRGRILFDGQEMSGLNDKQRTRMRLEKIGFIFQSFNLIPVLTALENVEFPLSIGNGRKRDSKATATDLLELVGLKDYLNRRPFELSGGQQQRVAIARALAGQPKVVLADEPTANLDSANGESILGLMREINAARKTTFIFSTHDPRVLRHAQRKVEMVDGMIVEGSG